MSFVLGVLDIISEKKNVRVIGKCKGTVKPGDTLYLYNPGETGMGHVRVFAAEVMVAGGEGFIGAESATDEICCVGLAGDLTGLKIASVIASNGADIEDVRDQYVNALGDVYVIKKKLELTEAEFEKLSFAESCEIWRLFDWYHSNRANEESDEEKQEVVKKMERIARYTVKKFAHASGVYCVVSKATGEPYMFSRTIQKEDSYICTPPYVRVIPEGYVDFFKEGYTTDEVELRYIVNKDSRGLFNFVGDCLYLNGAYGIEFISEQSAVKGDVLVQKPDTSNMPKEAIPVTNPDLERWILLLGQLPNIETEENKVLYRLYMGPLSAELSKAHLIVPMQVEPESGKAVPDEGEKGKLNIAVMPGRESDKPAVRMYTDWKRMRMMFGEGWNGLNRTVDSMIDKFDCLINLTASPKSGVYISGQMYNEMKKLRNNN